MDNKSKKRNSNNSYIPLNQYSYSQNNRGNLAPGIVQWIQKNRNNIQFDNRNRRNEQRQNNEISRSSLNQFFRNEDRNNNLVNIDNQDLNNYVQNEANRIIQNQRNYYQSDEYRQRLNNAGVSLSNQTRLSNQLNSTNRPNISILSSEQFRDFHPNSSTIGSTHYRRTTGQSGQTYNPGIYFNRDYLRRQHQYDRIPEYIQHETSHWADRLTPDAQRYNESLIEGNLRPEVSEYRSNPREIRARGMVVLQNYLNNRNQYRDLDDYLDNSNDNSDALYDLRNNIFRDEQSMRNYLNHFVSNDITNQNGYQLYYAKKGGFITPTTYGTTYSDRSKLVSKNSVQRFKQGRKIQYYEIGGTARKVIRGWKEALFPWTIKKQPKPQQKKKTPQQTKQKNDRANNVPSGYFWSPRKDYKDRKTDPDNTSYNDIMRNLLRNGYRIIDGELMSPEEQKEYYKRKRNPNNQQSQNPSTTTQQSNPQQSETSNVTNDATTNVSSDNSFNSAFNAARNSGQKEFIWNGGRYNTQIASEKGYIWSNQYKKWINPKTQFTVPSITEPTQEELDELDRRAIPRSDWQGASFAKKGSKLIFRNSIKEFKRNFI